MLLADVQQQAMTLRESGHKCRVKSSCALSLSQSSRLARTHDPSSNHDAESHATREESLPATKHHALLNTPRRDRARDGSICLESHALPDAVVPHDDHRAVSHAARQVEGTSFEPVEPRTSAAKDASLVVRLISPLAYDTTSRARAQPIDLLPSSARTMPKLAAAAAAPTATVVIAPNA